MTIGTEQNTLTIHTTAAPAYTLRREHQGDTTYAVVPVVMMVEGVHIGSQGPLYHSAQELSGSIPLWEGTPITIRHPQDREGNYLSARSEGVTHVGMVRNASMQGERLRAEAWLDEAILNETNPAIMAYLEAGRPMDVSIGVFTNEEKTSGEWKGERYEAISRNHQPDHLALLPGEQGACGWEDGCGLRLNSSNKNKNGNEMTNEERIRKEKQDGVEQLARLSLNIQGYTELLSKLQRKLDSMDNEQAIHFLEEAYEGHIVYRRTGGTQPQTSYLRQSYQTDAEGQVELIGEAVPVRREVSYVQVNESSEDTQMRRIRPQTNTNHQTQSTMEKKSSCFLTKVEKLVANTATQFTEADREWLLAQEETTLDKLVPVEQKPGDGAPPQINKEQITEIVKGTKYSTEEFLAMAQGEVKESLQAGMRMYQAQKASMVASILANAEGVYTEEGLQGMEFEELERLHKLATRHQPADYSARGGFGDNGVPVQQVNQSCGEMLLPPGVAESK